MPEEPRDVIFPGAKPKIRARQEGEETESEDEERQYELDTCLKIQKEDKKIADG